MAENLARARHDADSDEVPRAESWAQGRVEHYGDWLRYAILRSQTVGLRQMGDAQRFEGTLVAVNAARLATRRLLRRWRAELLIPRCPSPARHGSASRASPPLRADRFPSAPTSAPRRRSREGHDGGWCKAGPSIRR